MSVKGFFKGLLHGIETYGPVALGLLTGLNLSPRVSLIANTIFDSIHFAEANWPSQGSGIEKAAFVQKMTLTAMETATGRNYDNPSTRALVDAITSDYVQAMNLMGSVREQVASLESVLKSTKDPAIPDQP